MLAAFLASLFWGVSLFCCGAAIAGCAYALFAAGCLARFRQSNRAAAAPGRVKPAPTVTVLKPLYGVETGLRAALDSFCRQDYGAPLEIVFGVQSAADRAMPIVRSLMADHPDRSIELVVDPAKHGTNDKVSNLVNMESAISHDVVVLADSDIVVEPGYLRAVVAPLAAADIGIVTCLYHGVATGTVWSRLSAAAIDWHFLPSVLVGHATGLAYPCLGSTIALRHETLRRIGGFESVADQLADDYALGGLARQQGLRIAFAPVVVGHLCQERSFGELWRHEIRWARTIRLVDPAGFLGSFVTHTLPLALIGTLAAGFVPWSLAILAAALASRVLLVTAVRRIVAGRRLDFPLLLLRDILSFAVFVASLFALRVRWRDRDFDVAGDGTLKPLKEDSQR